MKRNCNNLAKREAPNLLDQLEVIFVARFHETWAGYIGRNGTRIPGLRWSRLSSILFSEWVYNRTGLFGSLSNGSRKCASQRIKIDHRPTSPFEVGTCLKTAARKVNSLGGMYMVHRWRDAFHGVPVWPGWNRALQSKTYRRMVV